MTAHVAPARLTALWLVLSLAGLSDSSRADEPDAADCTAALVAVQPLIDALPASDLSRRMAESHVVQARVEAGNREFDECVEMAERARLEVMEHRHVLLPGESLQVPLPPPPAR